ncbi:hypothetical protein R1flu_002874 [Riccia fluitans]|uniref:DNA-binding protein PTAC3 n=1 Tax=Riccia fluitans TaxID=41844 RepID=A0ABD1YB50_9MARC
MISETDESSSEDSEEESSSDDELADLMNEDQAMGNESTPREPITEGCTNQRKEKQSADENMGESKDDLAAKGNNAKGEDARVVALP